MSAKTMKAASLLLLLAGATYVQAAASVKTCSSASNCPSTAPCCSEFGFCGSGSYCLGGCNPFWSFAPEACIPAPACESKTYTFNDPSRIVNASWWNGDASARDWLVDQGSPLQSGNDMILTLTEHGGGTRLSSTRSMLYGTATARLRASRWGGVVTAFVLFSGVKDEQDWEFPGGSVYEAQSNFFFQGVPDYTNGGVENLTADASTTYHDYGFDWQPDAMHWTIDGTTVRTVTKESTLNEATGIYEYPQTPSRVQLSIWPAGINSSAQGTVDWAGGMIDWTDPDYTSVGYYYAMVESVTVSCYVNPSFDAGTADAYVYGANSSGLPTVLLVDRDTKIFSHSATGLDMNAGKDSDSVANSSAGIINAAISPVELGWQRGAAIVAAAGAAAYMLL